MYLVKTKWTTARKQEHDGFRYDSGFEASYATELDLRVRAKDIKSYDKQVNLDLVVNGYVVCQYRIDFIIHHNDGTREYVETKGYATDTWKLKWKLFEALYSDRTGVKLTVVYQGRNNPKLRKLKKKINAV